MILSINAENQKSKQEAEYFLARSICCIPDYTDGQKGGGDRDALTKLFLAGSWD
jgi:hypothetical protein